MSKSDQKSYVLLSNNMMCRSGILVPLLISIKIEKGERGVVDGVKPFFITT